jgi:uncharacterized protein with HEPN domain
MKDQRLHLVDLLERIRMIESFTVGGRQAFMDSLLVQEGVIRCYEVIGEIVKRLSPDLLAPHSDIPWRQIAGFRDFLIHHYDRIDLDVVWKTVEDDLPQLKRISEEILNSLNMSKSS